MDIKQIKEIKDKIRKSDKDRLYAMFSAEERALISKYIKLSTNNGEDKFFAEVFNVSESCNITLDQFNKHFAPKLEISRSNPFRELSREELKDGKNLIMNHVRTHKKGMKRNIDLEEYLKNTLKDKEELWRKVISVLDENNRYSNEGDFVEFIINGNKEIVMCGWSPYVRINLLFAKSTPLYSLL